MTHTKDNDSTRFYSKYTNDQSNDIKRDSEGIRYISKQKLIKSSNTSIRGSKNKRQVTAKFSHIYL